MDRVGNVFIPPNSELIYNFTECTLCKSKQHNLPHVSISDRAAIMSSQGSPKPYSILFLFQPMLKWFNTAQLV